MKRFVLWDLDGTLVDSGADIVWSANETRRSMGFEPLPEATVRSFIGEGSPKLMASMMGPDERLHAPALARFLEIYSEHLTDRTRPYNGIDELVRQLAGRQAIVTNKPGDFARRLVTHLGWTRLFDSVIGADDVANKKPAADMVEKALANAGVAKSDAVLVGDTTIDIATAKAAGVDMICVSWGLRPSEDLSGAPKRVDTVDELAAALLS